jgi:hypothetical protein
MKNKSLLIVSMAFLLCGCATIVWKPGQGGLVYTQPANLKAKSTFDVKVFKSASEVPYAYQRLGAIRYKPWVGSASPSKRWQSNQMKVEAAKRGADGIILPETAEDGGKAMEAIAIIRSDR